MKLEKFNLKKAIIHRAKVVTRDGREVKQLTRFENAEPFTLAGVVGDDLLAWTDEGDFDFCCLKSDKDLFLAAVEPRRAWVNVWRDVTDGGITIGKQHESKEEAESRAKHDRYYIKTIEITDEL